MKKHKPAAAGKPAARILNQNCLEKYRRYLAQNEYAASTTRIYVSYARAFCEEMRGRKVTKNSVLALKKRWSEHCSASSVNIRIAAINNFLGFLGWQECKIKSVKTQSMLCRESGDSLTKGEYLRLLDAAKAHRKEKLYYIIETLCSTGIRVSEIRYITAEAAMTGTAQVRNKGKTRVVFLPQKLREQLCSYCSAHQIRSGCIFVTRSGRPIDRSNIWTMMKRLSAEADVDPAKVFPHNLRHLFACTFYEELNDLDHLAVVLGHSSIDTTRIYTRASGSEYQKQVDKLELVL